MAGTALSTTTAGSMSLATMAPLIDWALNGCPRPAPPTTSLAIAALLIPLVHLVYLWLVGRTRVAVEEPAPPIPAPSAGITPVAALAS